MGKIQDSNIDTDQKTLASLLKKLFRIEEFGDYGIFRILQFKRDRINRFIEIELPQIIENNLKEVSILNQKQVRADIFSGIYQFFSRYYQKGDLFQARKFAKENKFMIPYNGQETLLHWVHKDYYYIKTEENYRNFTFLIDKYTIHFHLSEISDIAKKDENLERVVTLRENQNIFYDAKTKCLEIYFNHQSISDLPKLKKGETLQDHFLAQIYETIIHQISDETFRDALQYLVPGKQNPRLMDFLRIYTHRNTADFFIHRNLRSFLLNELDYYIKHELIDLESLFHNLELHQLSQIKIIHTVCTQIIQFLSQIEDFEKALWEKKPFVVKSDYCITLDRVPEDLLGEIFENSAQIQQWQTEYSINLSSIPGQLAKVKKSSKMGDIRTILKQISGSLCNFDNLVTDTKFFSVDFKLKLLNSFEDLDVAIEGLCIKSENWRALNFLSQKLTRQVKCIYIDPPYNTGADDFIYKDNYQHSSWLTMMANRLELAKELLKDDGIFFCSIDDHEEPYLNQLVETIFGHKMDNIIWHKKTQPSFLSKEVINVTEYIIPAKVTANIVPMVGGFGDKDKLAELINQSNEVTSRVLPKDHVIFGNQWTGTLTVGEYGKGTSKIRLTQPLTITNGLADQDIPLVGRFKWTQETIHEEITKGGQIFIKSIKSLRPTMKRVFDSDIIKAPITLLSKKINDIPTNTDATNELKDLFGISPFDYSKPAGLLKYLYRAATYFDTDAQVLDFFAGSGTTAQAILELNAEDNGNRKYTLVELGDVFDTVILPRIRKLMYSQEWKEGKPVQSEGYSHCFQYLSLEQYTDTMNNIEFNPKVSGQESIEEVSDFFLHHMLEFETHASPSRLNIDQFQTPYNYRMKIINRGTIQSQSIDLVETLNFLFGMTIQQYKTVQSQNRLYILINGLKEGHPITIIWRDIPTLDLIIDKTFIEQLRKEHRIATDIYINSPCNVAGVRFIEIELMKLI